MRSPQSNAMEPPAGAGWPSSASAAAIRGAAKATTRYPRGSKLSERQQEYDPRGGAECAGADRLDLGREPLLPGSQPAEHQGGGGQAAAPARAQRPAGRTGNAEAAAKHLG